MSPDTTARNARTTGMSERWEGPMTRAAAQKVSIYVACATSHQLGKADHKAGRRAFCLAFSFTHRDVDHRRCPS
jgi:hypothetical protein